MIRVFGNDIKGAFTGGTPVKEIYSYGVKVWPDGGGDLPEGYERVTCIYNTSTTKSSAPQLSIALPAAMTKFVLEMDYLPYRRSGDIVFTYGMTGQFDTHFCYLYISSDPYIKETIALNSGTTTGEGSTGILLNESDISRGKLIWDYRPSGYSGRPYITWKEHNQRSYARTLSSILIHLLSSNTYEQRNSVSLGKIYGVVIKDENGDVIMNLVPALETATEKAGLYDTLNDVFYSNKANGTIYYDV